MIIANVCDVFASFCLFRIIVQNVVDDERNDPGSDSSSVVSDFIIPGTLDGTPISMKYLDNRMYIGLDNGILLVYIRDKG